MTEDPGARLTYESDFVHTYYCSMWQTEEGGALECFERTICPPPATFC